MTTKPREHDRALGSVRMSGYDNCKMIFILYVVLWHTFHLDILDATFRWGASPHLETLPSTNSTTSESSWWDRAKHQELSHHGAWTAYSIHAMERYWLWTEKVAVPGFCFISGYFGKSFLAPSPLGGKLEDYLSKERARWQKTIAILLIGPLLLQAFSGACELTISRLFHGPGNLTPSALSFQMDIWDNLSTWYLFALLLWRTWSSVFLARMRQSWQLQCVLSLGLALLSAHTSRYGPQEMRQRVFYFFPYYVAGLHMKEPVLDQIVSSLSSERKTEGADRQLRESRVVGLFGIALTMLILQVAPREYLGWMYTLDSYDCHSHLIFLLQYFVAGIAVVSIILFVRTIRVPLFPWSHSFSTLAVYEWHWPVANLLAWGNLPYTSINIFPNDDSFVQKCFGRLSPVELFMTVHVVCYTICSILGSRFLWHRLFRYVSDPQWAGRLLFVSPRTSGGKVSSGRSLPLFQDETR